MLAVHLGLNSFLTVYTYGPCIVLVVCTQCKEITDIYID